MIARLSRALCMVLIASCLLLPTIVFGGTEDDAVVAGNKLYEAGDFEGAVKSYDLALAKDSGDARVMYNKGVAHYRLGDYESAAGMFGAASACPDPELSSLARYNLGNSLYRKAEAMAETDLAGSVEAYRQSVLQFAGALALDPDLQVAAENIEIARRDMAPLLAELKKRSEDTPDGQPDNPDQPPDPGDGNDKQGDGVDEEAQAVLDEERGQRQENSSDRTGDSQVDKDW